MLDRLGVLAGRELEHAVIEKQQADRQVERTAGQDDVQRFTGAGAGPWGLAADEQ
ncbi:hypothetical protein D3C76_1683570 [compost metagenome]